MEKQFISIETNIQAPVEEVWKFWTIPEHIKQWNNASADWYTPTAENDLREGGTFSYYMSAKDGSAGFNFGGTYKEVRENELLVYTIDDSREVRITFENKGTSTRVMEVFEPESTHPNSVQKEGWQAILNNFKQYVEQNYQTQE